MVHFKLVQEVEHERGLLRALMENIPDLIYFKDRESRFTRVNQAHARSLGASDAAACVGTRDSDYFGSGDALRWRLQEEEIVRSGQSQIECIEQINNPGGGRGWWSITKVPMFDRTGRVYRDRWHLQGHCRFEAKRGDAAGAERAQPHDPGDGARGVHRHGPRRLDHGVESASRADLRMGRGGSKGRRLGDIAIAPASREALSSAQGSLPRQLTSSRAIELVAIHRDGREFPLEATVWPVRVGDACRFHAFVRGYQRSRKAATLIQLLQAVTVAANRCSTIEHATQACLSLICTHLGWPVGHCYLRAAKSSTLVQDPVQASSLRRETAPGPSGGALRAVYAAEELISTGLWQVEEAGRFEAFRAASDRWRFVAGAGLVGRILASGKPEWIVDVRDEGQFLRADVAARAGLRSGFGFPILVDDKVMGIVEFFSFQTVPPDEELLTILGSIGSQLGQVIVRQRVEQDLQRAKSSAESANRTKSEFLTTMSS